AEDGIRDDLVTGVQTCALPICPRPLARLVPTGGPTLLRGVQRPLSPDALEAMDAALHEAQARSRDQILQSAGDQHLARVRRGGRSEERRVGKEGELGEAAVRMR